MSKSKTFQLGVTPFVGEREERFERFKRAVLDGNTAYESSHSNANMKRTTAGRNNSEQDEAYRRMREKNNAAAKRSRDARRMREDEAALRTAFLEVEYVRLMRHMETVKAYYRRQDGQGPSNR